MKKISAILMVLFLVLVFSAPMTAQAEDLSVAQKKILEDNGILVYPGAFYLTGDDEVATVMWFASEDPVDKIMDWFKDKLSGWLEMEVNGSRITYKGPGSIEAKDVSTRPYIFARTTDENPGSTDSEITVRIPK